MKLNFGDICLGGTQHPVAESQDTEAWALESACGKLSAQHTQNRYVGRK